MGPGLTAALSFSIADILLKVVYAAGMDTLTLVTLRGILVVAFFWAWLKIQRPPKWHTKREKWIAVGLGILFAGMMYGLLKSISMLPVSIAILAYFVYPLLTGIGGAITGVDHLSWRAMLSAVTAFGGLGLMLGADIGNLSWAGLAYAFGAAMCRVLSLLGTRAWLAGTDARVTTWYSMVPSTLLFLAGSIAVGEWHVPQTNVGWWAFIGISILSTLSTLMIYVSTNRVGPFRTAFVMNLEPLLTMVLSMVLLGEHLTPVQLLGAAIMLAALCAFQFARVR